jgi:flagellar basal body-associated protein FliL
MKRKVNAPRGLIMFYRVLLIIALALVVAIAAGTLWAFVTKPWENAAAETKSAPAAAPLSSAASKMFTGLGRLRIPLAGGKGAAVVNIVFPYDEADTAFTEELARNTPRFRESAEAIIGGLAPSEPLLRDEAALKAAVLKAWNEGLVLGKISELYFYDFMVLD